MSVSAYEHTPVLLDEVLLGLHIHPAGCYVDCTFGRGGHSRAILQKIGERGKLFAFDRDPDAIRSLDDQLRTDKRFTLLHGSYTMLRAAIEKNNMLHQVDGILLDLGVSSPQLEDADRGFSFRNEGPLDMRMDNSRGMTAAEWLNTAGEKEIAKVLKTYGEERFAGKIARAIIATRLENKIVTTRQLADLISRTVPVREKDKHPATRSFQAIRIFINRELDELQNVLTQTIDVLAAGGRLVVISFHSLEDRMVKRFMRNESRGDDFPPDLPVTTELLKPKLKLVGKAIYPSVGEIERNPRARSAVLRIAERTAS
jgi:16S rRNA (cytosine1402-N4)-methyltransferase